MRDFSQPLYDDFADHLRHKANCRLNRLKMINTLNRIISIPGGEQSLLKFLSQNFPHVLAIVPTTQPPAVSPVFDYYDPNLLTIPMRRIIHGANVVNLADAVRNFCADKIESDYVIVNNTAYIEYLTTNLADIVDKIPAENWLVRQWRKRHPDM